MTNETIEVFEPTTPTTGEGPGPEVPVEAPTPAPDAPVDDVLSRIMARIKPVTEAPLYAKFLIYGPPGAGKTKLAGEAKNNLVVDIEKGAQTLKNHESTQHSQVLEYKSLMQLELVIGYIEKGDLKVDTLIIDSFTTLAERSLDALVKSESAKDASRNQYVPQLQDYNANTNHMRRVADLLRNVPCNVIAIAQAKEVKDESTGRLLMRPAFTDKLGTSLNHLFDTIGYLTLNDQGERQLQVHHSDKITAKTRIGGLPTVITNPNINTLIAANAAPAADATARTDSATTS